MSWGCRYGFQIWCGPLSGGGVAAVLANLDGNQSQTLTLSPDELPPSRRATAKWDLAEAYSGVTKSDVTLPATAVVGPHDVTMWVLTPAA